MRVFILAGGYGSRLQPYTDVLPKCLLPVYSKPCVRWIIEHLLKQDFNDIVACINEPYEKLWKHEFRDLKVRFSVTESPCGTAGEILAAAPYIQGKFLLVFGDDLSFMNYKTLIEYHKSKKDALATLAVTKKVPLEVGVVSLKGDVVTAFKEKPYLNMRAWTGVACLEPEILNYLSVGADFARDVFPTILQHGGKLYAYSEDIEWLDIGSLAHFKKACEKAQRGELGKFSK